MTEPSEREPVTAEELREWRSVVEGSSWKAYQGEVFKYVGGPLSREDTLRLIAQVERQAKRIEELQEESRPVGTYILENADDPPPYTTAREEAAWLRRACDEIEDKWRRAIFDAENAEASLRKAREGIRAVLKECEIPIREDFDAQYRRHIEARISGSTLEVLREALGEEADRG